MWEQLREYKQNVEQHYIDSAVSSVLGARLSKSQYKIVRVTKAFNPSEESTPRSHTSAMENIHYDVDKLVAKVESMPDQGLN